jgi:hemerythrin-like domain-containing protein
MKSTNYLIQEHKIILRALDVLDAMSAGVEAKQELDERDVDELLDFLRWFGDAHHQAKEETILFPALKTVAAAQARPVEHMTLEHNQERALIEELEKNVRLRKLSDFVSSANRLSSVLRNHIYKEDEILFETADSIFDAQEDGAVLEQLERFDTAGDKRVLEEKLRNLHSLEWKYLRK